MSVASASVAADFVERFTSLWADPHPDGFPPMFHPEATIYWPGMAGPMSPPEVAAHFRDVVQAMVPDIRLTPQRWASAGEIVFIEWVITGTRDSGPLSLPGVDRFVLRGDKAVAMRAYFDTAVLLGG